LEFEDRNRKKEKKELVAYEAARGKVEASRILEHIARQQMSSHYYA
jgi:hypothetical protein